MIVRIVKMTFEPSKCEAFLEIFKQYREAIRNQPGCSHLELWRETGDSNVFFTYSHWEDQSFLDAYRVSATFGEVWPQTKALFSARPEAWSVDRQQVILG